MGYNKERYVKLKMVAYYILFGVWYVVSLFPLRVLYIFSSLFAFILYHVIKYRRDVVHKNLSDSFPDMPKNRLKKIERRFYTHFCDLIMESIKYFSISKSEMKKRMRFKGLEQLDESYANGKQVALYLGHYANWEWISSMPLWVTKYQCSQMYHPLENLVFDKLIGYTRERFGGINIPVDFCIRHMIESRKQGRPVMIGFIADQAPYWTNIHYWTNFLNHPDTPVFTGSERLIKKFDMDVFFLDVKRVKRGYYEVEFKLMTRNAKECPDFWLTEQYTRLFEENIMRAPAYWLWSHRRWKRTKEEWERDWANKTS